MNRAPAPETAVRRTPMTVDETATYLGTNARHVRHLVAEKRIPFVKVGRLLRFIPEEIDAWLATSRVQAAG